MRRLRPRSLLRAVSATLAFVVAITAGMTLPSYVWCAGSQEVHLSCCCPHAGEASSDTLRAPCCELRDVDDPEAAHTRDASARVVAAPLAVPVAVLEWTASDGGAHVAAGHDDRARAGPSARLHAKHSIYLL